MESILIRSGQLDHNPWKLSSDIAFLQMLERLNGKTVPLSKVANIFNGIQTSAERPEKFSDKKAVKPYFKPTKSAEKGMETYSALTTDKQIIFPYDSEGRLIRGAPATPVCIPARHLCCWILKISDRRICIMMLWQAQKEFMRSMIL
ncbi:MAG: hypothetical protein HFH76_17535 [Lachnospiraceae bacterium]|nr:hypothetical protein [Lachnospiraceae bacterium]